MRLIATALVLLLAACAPRPAPRSVPGPAQPSGPATADRHDHRTLNGMTAHELVEHFGRPRIQIREGDGTKIQFAGRTCVLDVYLYPGQGGVARVAHIDARNMQGSNVDAQACVYALEDR